METASKVSAPQSSVKREAMSEIAELRRTVQDLAEQLASVAERRGRAFKEGAEDGVEAVRSSIRRQPAVAVGVAVLAGALLAVLVVPRGSHRRAASRRENWMPSNWAPSISRADLYDVADNIKRSVSRATGNVPSSIERLVDSVTHMESPQAMNDMLQKIGAWFQKAKSSAS
jgi:ElaB/YqjD/DUF883 family membrane-anchored ribosome-binding protein